MDDTTWKAAHLASEDLNNNELLSFPKVRSNWSHAVVLLNIIYGFTPSRSKIGL